jgi:ribulose-5-phosphate 4-epimerase/fuculose-1-phosphate aldolase
VFDCITVYYRSSFVMPTKHIQSELSFTSLRNVVEGNHPVNRAAFAIHSKIHIARPDVMAAAHSHSLYGKTWSIFGRPLDAYTQDACAFYEVQLFVCINMKSIV